MLCCYAPVQKDNLNESLSTPPPLLRSGIQASAVSVKCLRMSPCTPLSLPAEQHSGIKDTFYSSALSSGREGGRPMKAQNAVRFPPPPFTQLKLIKRQEGDLEEI